MEVFRLVLLSALLIFTPEYTLSHLQPVSMEDGRKQLLRLHGFAKHPRFGDCWTAALRRVDVGCRQLNEDEQSRIALAFTHCHLHRSGRDFPECTETSSVKDCTQHMDTVAFGTYTEFFTHAHSICYFLQNEVWQQQAEDTILRLTVNSDSVARQLEATNNMAEEMIRAQNATLLTQEEILQNGDLLKRTLQDSTQGVKQAFEEMQHSATEQRLLFSEIFNRVAYLHQFVVGESNTLYSFLYNLMACAAVFLVTSTRRTAGARLMLFGLVAMNVYVERLICSFVLENTEASGYEQMDQIAFWVGLARKTSATVGLAVLGYFGTTYRDVHQQNLRVLQCLRETQAELQHIVREAERLLARPNSTPPQRRSFLTKQKETFGDSGMLEPSVGDICNSATKESPLQTSQLVLHSRSLFGATEELAPASQPVVQLQISFDAAEEVSPVPPLQRMRVAQRRITSTPLKGSASPSCKPSRRNSTQLMEPVVYNIPVSLDNSPRYNLRSVKSPGPWNSRIPAD